MFPYIEIFGRTIGTYGVLTMIGCLATMGFIVWQCKKKHVDWMDEMYMVLFFALFALIGAKLLYQIPRLGEIFTYRNEIFLTPQTMINYFGSGFVYYGGLIGGLCGLWVYKKCFKVNISPMIPIFVPCIPLFHMFGRIGCFLAGCCYGIAYNGPGAVVMEHSLVGPNGIELLPIQLIEAGANGLIFVMLLLFERKERRPLQGLGLYLATHGVLRFVLEFFRGDLVRGIYMGLSTSQWISVVRVPLGLWLLLRRRKSL